MGISFRKTRVHETATTVVDDHDIYGSRLLAWHPVRRHYLTRKSHRASSNVAAGPELLMPLSIVCYVPE